MTYYSLIYEKLGNWNKAVSKSKSVELGFKNTHTTIVILILLFEARHLKMFILLSIFQSEPVLKAEDSGGRLEFIFLTYKYL